MIVAGSIFTAHHKHIIIGHLLCATCRYISFSLLGNHIGDIAFLGPEVITHGFTFVLLVAILKERVSKFLANGIEAEFGKHQTTVHVHFDYLRLQFYLTVLYVSFSE